MGRKHQNGGVIGKQRIYYDGNNTGVHDLQTVYDGFSGSPTNREGFNRGNGYSTSLYSFTSHTFTSAGAAGAFGPTSPQLAAAYQNEVWYSTYFSTTGGIQIWTAPETRTYEIELRGASGGGNTTGNYNPCDPGQGALVITRVTLDYGVAYNIVVGQTPTGVIATKHGSAGGGGSWIYTGTIGGSGLIAVAGGGGGWGHGRSSTTGGNGLGGNNANDSRRVAQYTNVNGKVGNGTGATNGVGYGGGLSTTGSFGGAAGGAGWLSDGTDRTSGSTGTGGHSIGPVAWEGGISGDNSSLNGGFGGGGMSNGNGEGGGGGGGYTGGPAGNDWSGNQWGNAGGGGSYWTGSLQSVTRGLDGGGTGHLRNQATNGYVKITAI